MKKLLFTLLLAGITAFAFAETPYSEDKHYQRVIPPQSTANSAKIEVVEIFWYGCPHCYDFEPFVKKWLADKPADVEFVRMPGVFNKNWVPHARAYYTAEQLGVLEQIHSALFTAIHKDQERVFDQEALSGFFQKHGVAQADFDKVYNSYAIDAKVRKARRLSMDYGISGVPAVIINGKYRSSGTLAGNYDELLNVMDTLIESERQQLTAQKK